MVMRHVIDFWSQHFCILCHRKCMIALFRSLTETIYVRELDLIYI